MIKNFMTAGAFSKGRKRGEGWERCGTYSMGSGGHNNLRLTPPWSRERCMTS
jgi:hypothetical protein